MSGFNHKLFFKSAFPLVLYKIILIQGISIMFLSFCFFTFLVAQQTNIHVSYLSVHTVALLHLLEIQMFSSLVFQLWDIRTYVIDAFSFLLKVQNLEMRCKQSLFNSPTPCLNNLDEVMFTSKFLIIQNKI